MADSSSLGGENNYGYVPNPVNWVDPLGLAKCWSSARRQFWKNEAKINPGKYSAANIERMKAGSSPRMRVEVISRKTGLPQVRDVSMELHHRDIPQRVGGKNVHDFKNLDNLTPWEHEAVDEFRHTGYDLSKIIKGVDIW